MNQRAKTLLTRIENLRWNLPHLVSHYLLVHCVQPLQVGIEDAACGSGRWQFTRRIRQRREIKVCCESGVQRVNESGFLPPRCQIRWAVRELMGATGDVHRAARSLERHGLTIQFPTSPTNRAATALRPPW